MVKKILVTGAGGFIGTALGRHLDAVGASWMGIGRKEFPRLEAILNKHKPAVIFHLAGGRADDVLAMAASNVLTTIHLLETISKIPGYRPRVLMAGSAAEYGSRTLKSQPIKEQSAARPDSSYGQIKLLQTKVALYYAHLGQDVVVARMFNIIGPGIPVWMAAGKFAKGITVMEKRRGKKFTVADLSAARDFLDIRDIVEALIIITAKGKKGEIYNVCSGQKTLMRDLLSAMVQSSRDPSMAYHEDRQQKPGVLYAIGSNAKLRRISSWEPKYNLQQSIEDTLDYYRKRL